jgi:hypothetical protein
VIDTVAGPILSDGQERAMTDMTATDTQPLSAAAHAEAMRSYIEAGLKRAYELGNRGPIVFGSDGKLDPAILDAYWETGFFVFENAIRPEELEELRRDVDDLLARAPAAPGSAVDRNGRPAFGLTFKKPPFRYAKPLSDPLGGTTLNKGRHPVKMLDPTPDGDAPELTINGLDGNLQLLDSCLRLYGHPGLLTIAEAINGPDFVPYNEVAFIKEPGLGPSVAWHQDGTTHWDAPDWDEGAHGYNTMVQLYPSTPSNCVWMLPGSHRIGKADIKKMVAESGSERIEGAVPMVCKGGDVIVLNRQCVHGSFANTSMERRVTLNEGFFPRKRVLNVTTEKLDGVTHTYDAERIEQRSRIIQLGIDARRQYYTDETPYTYQPLVDLADEIHWDEAAREAMLKDYNLRDMYI